MRSIGFTDGVPPLAGLEVNVLPPRTPKLVGAHEDIGNHAKGIPHGTVPLIRFDFLQDSSQRLRVGDR